MGGQIASNTHTHTHTLTHTHTHPSIIAAIDYYTHTHTHTHTHSLAQNQTDVEQTLCAFIHLRLPELSVCEADRQRDSSDHLLPM